MKWFTWKRAVLAVSVVLVLVALGFGMLVLVARLNLFHAHEHCMKNAGLSLRVYANDHNDKFPYHTNGFGDAIVRCLKDSPAAELEARLFTAPGDDGRVLLECLRTGAHMLDDRCTRAYVQGLSETNNLQIALLFDRYPTRGGDHGRRPWGPWAREVWLLGSSMLVIGEDKWPEFRARQIELLIAEGFKREVAEKLYAPIQRPK